MKKVIIVGAGISGLTAGIYARQSGFDVTIYESHVIPGGASTSWRRKGYLFEGGIHWMTGSSKVSPYNKLWHEVGALDDSVKIYNKDPFGTYEYEGKRMYLWRDLDKLKKHLLEISLEDEKEISKLIKDIEKLKKMPSFISDVKGLKAKNKAEGVGIGAFIGITPTIPIISFYAKLSFEDYAQRYKSPALRFLFKNVIGGEYSAVGMVLTLAALSTDDGGYPQGGSLPMAARMAKRFLSLGGNIEYGKLVDKVIVEDGIARGISVKGERINADYVIVSQDTLAAIDKLFDKPIKEPWAEKMRASIKPEIDTFISVGVEADLKDEPENLCFETKEPFSVGGIKVSSITINNYAKFEGYAPEGCSALTFFVSGDTYDFWKSCKENGTYEAEKQRLAENFIKILNKKYPQTEGKIAVIDVATPLTYERYLHSYKGSWMSVTGKGDKMTRYPSKPDSIKNLCFAGQRLMPPGGLPTALETGRTAAQYLCLDTDTVFQGNM